ncbi:MAG: hypothetical protein ACRENP_15225 [Longimicrobiales bacterium]
MRHRAPANIIPAALLLVIPSLAWAQAPTLTFTPVSITGGQTATGVIKLASPAPAGGLVVQLLVIRFPGEPTVASVPATVTVPAEQSSAPFLITTTAVAQSMNVVVSLVAAGLTNTGRVTVLAPAPSHISLPVAQETEEKAIGEVTLNAAAPAVRSGGPALQ